MARRSGQKRRFRIEGSHSPHLPVLSLLCAWARHLKTRTQRGQAICTSVRPASTEDCTSGNETCTQNACASVPIRIASYSYTVTVSRTALYQCSVKLHWSPPSEYTLNTLHWNFFHRSGFLSNLRLSWKQSFPWNSSLYWIYFSHSRFLRNLCLPWKFSLFLTFFIIQNF